MKAYFIRRLLLIPPTLIGITLLVFAIVRMTPGGPVEQALSRLIGGEGKRASRVESSVSLSAAQVLEIEEKFDQDKGILRGYGEWLGVLPRDLEKAGKEFEKSEDEVVIGVPGSVHEVTVTRDGLDSVTMSGPEGVDLSEWEVRLKTPEEQGKRWSKWVPGIELKELPEYRAVIYRPGFDGLLQGSLGRSQK